MKKVDSEYLITTAFLLYTSTPDHVFKFQLNPEFVGRFDRVLLTDK